MLPTLARLERGKLSSASRRAAVCEIDFARTVLSNIFQSLLVLPDKH